MVWECGFSDFSLGPLLPLMAVRWMDYAAWYLVAIVFFFRCINFPRACERGYLPFFAGGCHRPAFFLVYWYVLLPVGLCCFHNIVLFLYICRVCSFIYEICFSWINYFYWWNLHDSTFCRWAFTLSLSLPSCRTFTGAPFRTSV